MRMAILAVVLSGILAFAGAGPVKALTGAGPQIVAGPHAAKHVEQVASRRYRQARRNGIRRPYYVPYACSRPYQYRYWQYYAPICYPL